LLSGCRLVVDCCIHKVQEQDIERTSLRFGGNVDERVRWQQWQSRQRIGNWIKVVNVKRANPLRLAVFSEGEVIGREARNRPSIRIGNHDIDDDTSNTLMKEQTAGVSFAGILGRWRG
jgi:hypothetical protein